MISFALPGILPWNGLEIPLDFPYLTIIFQGPPEHDNDDFSLRHPKMERGKRAKIFAPFDALDGYSDAVRSKDTAYTERIELSEEDSEELSRCIGILHRLTLTGRTARESRIVVAVTHYVPCEDEDSFAYGIKGFYATAVGVCRKVDLEETKTITVGRETIPLDSITATEADKVFDVDWTIEGA